MRQQSPPLDPVAPEYPDYEVRFDLQSGDGTQTDEVVRGAQGSSILVALAAAIVIGIIVFALARPDRPPEDPADSANGSQGSSSSTDPGPNPSADGRSRSGDDFVRWPAPPPDRKSYVMGRPGPQVPVRDALSNQALMYVNDRHNPTVIDLATGDQRELGVSEARTSDRFLVEFGAIVTADPTNANLPQHHGRSFTVSVHRGVPGEASRSSIPSPAQIDEPLLLGPRLCLDTGGCPGLRWTSGVFGDEFDNMRSLNEGNSNISAFFPVHAIAGYLGAQSWTTDGRWTTYVLDADPAENVDPAAGPKSLRIPTPNADAVVWVIEQIR